MPGKSDGLYARRLSRTNSVQLLSVPPRKDSIQLLCPSSRANSAQRLSPNQLAAPPHPILTKQKKISISDDAFLSSSPVSALSLISNANSCSPLPRQSSLTSYTQMERNRRASVMRWVQEYYLNERKFVLQKFYSDQNFVTKPNFRHFFRFLLDFCTTRPTMMDQISSNKNFVGQNFCRRDEFLYILSNESLSDKVLYCIKLKGIKIKLKWVVSSDILSICRELDGH